MDLDLAKVRAFTVTAELLHFGDAAARLGVSQQAVSKRLAALEAELGVTLLNRSRQNVTLTDAGRRFLEPARQVLEAADVAVGRARGAVRPLRLDVWGHLFAPMRTVAPVLDALAATPVEPGPARDLPSAAAALLRGEIDLAFGRVPVDDTSDLDGLTHRLARLEPVDALLSAHHPLAGAHELRPSDLRGSVLWAPAALERLDFLRAFAETFGIARHESGANLGPEHLVRLLAGRPDAFTLMPGDSSPPQVRGSEVRMIPLVRPTPLYAWSLLWRTGGDAHPERAVVVGEFARQAGRSRWLEYDPATDWLPAAPRR